MMKEQGDIHIHIDNLVLEGLPVRDRDGPVIQKAVERELARLITRGGLSSGLKNGGAFPSVQAGSMTVQGNGPVMIGKEIARTVYRGIR